MSWLLIHCRYGRISLFSITSHLCVSTANAVVCLHFHWRVAFIAHWEVLTVLLLIQLLCRVDVFDIVSCALMEILYVYLGHFLNSPINIRTSVVLLAEICNWLNSPVFVCVTDTHNRQTAGRTVKCQMSKWIYTAQFHTKHINCARFISISRTGSSSMSAKRRVPLLAVGPRSSTGGKF